MDQEEFDLAFMDLIEYLLWEDEEWVYKMYRMSDSFVWN